ncbi:MAG: alcohol dehydrogenase catalytic domain-containing protein [Gammaproteobacteria bacterium]|nr:alcohol dehydrogenase catalytic domain-containing protein [Gammaproteobacteria bacterium]MBU0815660.1 alcohol dehydrogenase catalytic domain-containing protein [Gammaproteobacteria bacterium]MBU1788132.1 alcohol dehydrogenase catalytic domain-containing protein [Gammaproteobacteria bacterium]
MQGKPMMRAVQKVHAGPGIELVDVSIPELTSPNDVLVRVSAAGICGSDLHVDDWTPSYGFIAPSLPVTLGHEFVGVVQSGFLLGKRVVVRPSVTCGQCPACEAGRYDDCERRTGIGMTRDGAFAPWVIVPLRNCVQVPDTLSDELAALAEPVSIAMQAIRVAGDLRGLRVLVMGPGTIGQGIAALARHAGAAQVIVSGFNDEVRLDALRQMGFHTVVDVADESLADATRKFTHGEPFDVVFEATGVPETITHALDLLRRNGIVIVTGIHSRALSVDLTTLVRRQQQLRGSFRPPESDWQEALSWIDKLGDVLAPMVSHVLPLSRAMEGFALAHGKQASKVLLRPETVDA